MTPKEADKRRVDNLGISLQCFHTQVTRASSEVCSGKLFFKSTDKCGCDCHKEVQVKDRYINKYATGGTISGWDTEEEALEQAATLVANAKTPTRVVTYKAIAKTEPETPPVKVTRL